MQNPAHVGMGHSPGRLDDEPGGCSRVVLVLRERGDEAGALDQFHAEVALTVVFADLIHRDDARVVEHGHGFGLILESAQFVVAGQNPRTHHLEGHRSVERDLPGLVHDAHTAAAQFTQDLVVAEVADRRTLGQAVAISAFGVSGRLNSGIDARSRGDGRAEGIGA